MVANDIAEDRVSMGRPVIFLSVLRIIVNGTWPACDVALRCGGVKAAGLTAYPLRPLPTCRRPDCRKNMPQGHATRAIAMVVSLLTNMPALSLGGISLK